MSKVGIVTDSSFCLPADLVQEYSIRFAPTHIVLDGKDYRDRIDITPAEFWAMFGSLKGMPTTSAATPGDFADVFNELAKTNEGAVCVVVSKALSATFTAAEQAKEEAQSKNHGFKVEIIDSKSSIGAMGFILLEAARTAAAGKSFDEVVEVAQNMVPRVKYVAAIETLKYLINIGRAPKTAVIGDWLGIKPLIGMVKDTGLVDSLGRERGKQKAMRRLVDLVNEYTDTSKQLHVMVLYSNQIEDGEQLKEMVTARYDCTEVFMTEFPPVAAASLGPVVGVCYYS